MKPSPEELGSMSLFAGLEPADLEQVASWFDIEERSAGASLTRQGAAGYAFFVLREGTATVIQDDEEIRQLGLFGTQFRSLEQQFPELAERIRTAYA